MPRTPTTRSHGEGSIRRAVDSERGTAQRPLPTGAASSAWSSSATIASPTRTTRPVSGFLDGQQRRVGQEALNRNAHALAPTLDRPRPRPARCSVLRRMHQ